MPIKRSRRYRKRNNKSRRARKNKTIRRYKNANARGNDGYIKNEEELKKSWENRTKVYWQVNDGVGDWRDIYSEDLSYEQFKEKINYYLKQVEKGQKDAYIKEIYH